MRYFKVLYDFQASDSVELSVKKGDLVCSPTDAVEQDGWIKVELASDTRRKGFVPVTYVKETTTVALSSQPQQQAVTRPQGASVINSATAFPTSGRGGAMVPVQQDFSAAPSPAPVVVTPASVTEAFMKNEVYFKQLMKQRQEALAKLEMGLGEAVADIAACKDKNATLARKLRDLDATIEKERKKWSQRVDEEKILIQRSATTGPTFTPAPQASGLGAGNFGGISGLSGGAYSGGYGSRSGSLSGQHNLMTGQTISTTSTTTTSRNVLSSTANNNESTTRLLDERSGDRRF